MHLVLAAIVTVIIPVCLLSGNSIEKSVSNSAAEAVVRSVALSVGLDELPEGNTTNAEIAATYSDGKTKKIPFGIQWKIGNPNIVTADGTRLTAKAEGTTTVQAAVNGKRSPAKRITVYKLIHGHRLPPEPEPKINNSTLPGVDVNRNGVRDDVERWIYETYDYPIERGLFMQSARAYQKVIVDPSKAHETTKYLDDVVSCELFLKYRQKDHSISRYRNIEKEISQIQFNTIDRHVAYKRYNAEFNGEVFPAPAASEDKCLFDENGHLKIQP